MPEDAEVQYFNDHYREVNEYRDRLEQTGYYPNQQLQQLYEAQVHELQVTTEQTVLAETIDLARSVGMEVSHAHYMMMQGLFQQQGKYMNLSNFLQSVRFLSPGGV